MHPKIESQITFFYTDNLKQTSEFYEQIIELPMALDQGSCRIYRVCKNSYVGFCSKLDGGQVIKNDVIFTLVTPDVDGWYQYLQKKGVVFEKPPQVNPKFGIYHTFLRDPNGYLIEIQRFEDPNWK